MASPSTVITLGYGSFGSVNLVPTLGYGIGAEAAVPFVVPEIRIRSSTENIRLSNGITITTLRSSTDGR